MSNYDRSWYTAVSFGETLSTANQNRILRHPIAQSKIKLTILQTGNLIPTCIYLDTILKSWP